LTIFPHFGNASAIFFIQIAFQSNSLLLNAFIALIMSVMFSPALKLKVQNMKFLDVNKKTKSVNDK
jgi:hypothetical protein